MQTKMTKEAIEMLEAMARENKLTPRNVILEARKKASPLHDYFEWNVKRAAWNHWVEQARGLIRSVHVIIETDEKVIRAPAYVHDPRLGNEQGYTSTLRMRTDVESARETVKAELQRAVSALRRANNVATALGLEEEVDKILSDMLQLQSRVTAVEELIS